ncbi:hypothetical protein [Ralstonia syzygii]|uniref:Uncharacterized protein n=1 Tax=Ralstonia syzygii R24 TaxID=907261 RepID=G3A3U6_9RALS|nr:hypothetical protein [Ralstonia syzygii]CCA88557.1 conserved hypothetical protein [Ralstonia syzygii R24]
MADQAEQRRDRAARGCQRAQDEAERHFESGQEARDRVYAAEYKLTLVERRQVVVADEVWRAERMADVDVGSKLDDWGERASHLRSVEQGLKILVDRFEHDREQAEFSAREYERKFATLMARANELSEKAIRHAEEYERCIEGAGL